MNLAIAIAVSDYADPRNNLPACQNDAALVKAVLDHSGRFDVILPIVSDTFGSRVKDVIAAFIKEHQPENGQLDEVFFYFTGHGEVYDGEFYYLLSDFDKNKRNQTSLSNTELDTMLRSLSPALTVKIVDACHSGVAYVKGEETLQKTLADSKARLNKCYFMFSSHADEVSFQDDCLSYFTKAFGQAVAQHPQSTLRYSAIADFIADAFGSITGQKPSFVTQADLTEIFCTISDGMRADIKTHLQKGGQSHPVVPSGGLASGMALVMAAGATTTSKPTRQPAAIGEQIQLDAKRYCTKDEAMKAFAVIKDQVQSLKAAANIESLYEREAMFLDEIRLANKRPIAKWLSENKHDYFVTLEYANEKYTAEVKVTHPFFMFDYDVKEVTKTRKVLDGFTQSAESPFKMIVVEYRPKYPNIPWWTGHIVPVFSKVSVRFFYGCIQLKELSWDERTESGSIEWLTTESGMKDESSLKTKIQEVMSGWETRIVQQLKERYEDQSA